MDDINLFNQGPSPSPSPSPSPDRPAPKTWAEKFELFHVENPDVYRAFCREVDKLWAKGFRRFGSQGVFWLIRANYGISAEGREFALNAGYAAHYARKYLRDHPERDGFFGLRELRT